MKVWDKDLYGQPCINTTPVGKRIPDGIIWAYEASGFYRIPSSGVVWSRSMIEEFGGCLDDDESINPEPSPSRLIPWLSRHSLSYDVDGILVTTRVSDDICEDGSSCAVPLAEKDVQDAPLLQQFITTHHLPEILLINDPHAYTGSVGPARTARYVRAIPPIARREPVPIPKIECLCTSPIARMEFKTHLGDGHHSSVYRATLQLLWVDSGVSIAVKIASSDVEACRMLAHEAKIYSSLPEHLMDDWSGFHYIEEVQYSGDGIVPVHAVVPKFYGFYIPMANDRHGSSMRPLLLIEDCGREVVPSSLTCEQRKQCSTLLARFHRAGYIHNSLYTRNILMQPGPLTRPPSLRSTDTPSFRLIDFGRAERYDRYRSRKIDAGVDEEEIIKQWQRNMCNELRVAKELFREI